MKRIKLIIFVIIVFVLISAIGIFALRTSKNKEVASSDSKTESVNTSNENTVNNINEAVDIEVKEDHFVAQIDDIFANPNSYLGKSLSIEGYIYNEDEYVGVVRKYFCCGTDSYPVGFICNFGDNKPNENDWVKAVGTVSISNDKDGTSYPVLNVSKFEVLKERGKEVVYN